MSTTVQYPKSTEDMADLISANLDFCSDWGRDRLLDWVQWFVNNDRYYAITVGGKLVGLTLVRMVDTEEQCHEHYKDTEGPICYIELAISRYPKSLNEMYRMIWNDWKEVAKRMAWARHKYDNRVTITDMKKVKYRFMGE